MRSFISELLSGASKHTSELNVIDPGPPPEMLAPPVPAPHDYQKARTLLDTSIERLTSRQAVLMREIAVRQGELFETNKTLEALASAADMLRHEHEDEPWLMPEDIASEGDAGVYSGPMADLVEDGLLPDLKATSPGSLLREATAAPEFPKPSTYGSGKPRGFA